MNAPAYRVAGRSVAPSVFYAQACDPARSVVVEACAGAGKTWMLVSRILRALLAGAQPQHILAITFTRKAAGEMRERLEQWLTAFSAIHATHEQRVAELCERGLSVAEARQLAPALGGLHEQLLSSGRRVAVGTVHGWFAQLAAHAPLGLFDRLGLPADHQPLEDITVLREALFRRLHRVVQAQPALQADYRMLVRRHRRGLLADWLAAAWHRGPELARADAAGHVADAVPPAAALWPACAGLDDPAELMQREPLATQLRTLAAALAGRGKVKAAAAADGLQASLRTADAATAFALAWEALFTKEGEPRQQLGQHPLLQTVQDELQAIHHMRRQQAAHEDHGAMLRLSRVLLSEYAALKRQRGLVDMADLERVAEALLGDSELAGWVQERLDQRVQHLLVDECQDTSPLQWQVLHGWLGSYAGAGGGASGQRPPAVFIVGDPKQSIYRFRNADPRVFAAAQAFVLEGLQGTLLQCDHTRRNAPQVIETLNAVFDEAQRLDGWGPYRAHSTASPTQGRICALRGVTRPARATRPTVAASLPWRDSLTQARDEPELQLRDLEAGQAADAVVALMAGHGLAPGEVMVLARKRAMLARVAQALATRGVPHVVAEALALHEAPESLDLVALLDVLASPGHDLALARALRCPLFGASDGDLLWLAEAAAPSRSWLDTLLRAGAPPSPELARARGLLAGWTELAGRLPPHDLLDRIVHEGDLLPRLAATVPAARRAAALHAVQALLGAALAHDSGRFATVYGFVRAVRSGRVQAPGVAPAAAVQLLTVHGAKGLEARAVILVDTDPQPPQTERATLLVDWPVAEPAPRRVAFVASQARLPPSLADAWALEAQARSREEINGLYVAMTRAREWLVFSHTDPTHPGVGRSWWQRVKPALQVWEPSPAGTPAHLNVAAPAVVAVAPRWAGLQAATPVRSPADNAAAARLGQAVHRMLEWAGRPALGVAALAPAEWDVASRAAASAQGLPAAAAKRVLALASRVLQSPECRRFFQGPALRWAGNEVPVAWQGEARRIDRLVALDEGGRTVWWVLDYKLQADPAGVPAYREQLRGYVAAVQALQPHDEVRGAFITGQGAVIPA